MMLTVFVLCFMLLANVVNIISTIIVTLVSFCLPGRFSNYIA